MDGSVTLELRALRAEIVALRAAFESLRPAPQMLLPAEIAALVALHEVFGTGAFTSSEAVAAARGPFETRRQLREALAALGADRDAQALGQLLRSIVARDGRAGNLRLVSPRAERGARLWAIETPREGRAPQTP